MNFLSLRLLLCRSLVGSAIELNLLSSLAEDDRNEVVSQYDTIDGKLSLQSTNVLSARSESNEKRYELHGRHLNSIRVARRSTNPVDALAKANRNLAAVQGHMALQNEIVDNISNHPAFNARLPRMGEGDLVMSHVANQVRLLQDYHQRAQRRVANIPSFPHPGDRYQNLQFTAPEVIGSLSSAPQVSSSSRRMPSSSSQDPEISSLSQRPQIPGSSTDQTYYTGLSRQSPDTSQDQNLLSPQQIIRGRTRSRKQEKPKRIASAKPKIVQKLHVGEWLTFSENSDSEAEKKPISKQQAIVSTSKNPLLGRVRPTTRPRRSPRLKG